jgi:hypothetical protein
MRSRFFFPNSTTAQLFSFSPFCVLMLMTSNFTVVSFLAFRKQQSAEAQYQRVFPPAVAQMREQL